LLVNESLVLLSARKMREREREREREAKKTNVKGVENTEKDLKNYISF